MWWFNNKWGHAVTLSAVPQFVSCRSGSVSASPVPMCPLLIFFLSLQTSVLKLIIRSVPNICNCSSHWDTFEGLLVCNLRLHSLYWVWYQLAPVVACLHEEAVEIGFVHGCPFPLPLKLLFLWSFIHNSMEWWNPKVSHKTVRAHDWNLFCIIPSCLQVFL